MKNIVTEEISEVKLEMKAFTTDIIGMSVDFMMAPHYKKFASEALAKELLNNKCEID